MKGRCGWCGETGHNKRSCAKYKTYLKQNIEAGSTWAEDEFKRITNKKCSFCYEYGHNRRVCKSRKQAIVDKQKAIMQQREVVKARLEEIGCGPGALVRFKTEEYIQGSGWTTKEVIATVVNINWDGLHISDVPSEPHSYRFGPCIMGHGDGRQVSLHWPDNYRTIYSDPGPFYTIKVIVPSDEQFSSLPISEENCRKRAIEVVDADYLRKRR